VLQALFFQREHLMDLYTINFLQGEHLNEMPTALSFIALLTGGRGKKEKKKAGA
jgi:hypothetical protein